MESRLAIHAVIPRTSTNGPGIRYGIWVQGCERKCEGCFNPLMLPELPGNAGEFVPPANPGWIDVKTLVGMIEEEHEKDPVEGIIVSGGEPFDQPEPLHKLFKRVREVGMSVLVFTGYTYDELLAKPETVKFFKPESIVDVLIDGPYDRELPVEGELRGSANQQIRLLTDRYNEDDLSPPGPLECIIQADGSVSVTGFTRPPYGRDQGSG